MSAPNPLADAHPTPPPPISQKTLHIAGIHTTILGLSELPPSSRNITIVWLLHPRLQDATSMVPFGSTLIHAYNNSRSASSTAGLIAITFDQRNHGTRQISAEANEAWRSGNPRHAQDMFSVFQGTAMDASLLMDHVGSYIFTQPGDVRRITQHFTFGISLGGHASWQCWFHEPRVTASVVVIGCPDYMRVMKDRARLSKLATYTQDNGASFLGSADFPNALIHACEKHDPKGFLFSTSTIPSGVPPLTEQARLLSLLNRKIAGKKLLLCSGGADKLVPYHCTQEFAGFLKQAVSPGGWYAGNGGYVEDVVYDGVGHALSEGMVVDSVRFFCNLLEGREPDAKVQKANL